MFSKIFNPKMDPSDESVPIENGGTAARTKEDACKNLGLVSLDQVRQPNGIILLGDDGLIKKEDLPHNLVNIEEPTLSALDHVGLGGVLKIYITNYSSDVDYVVTAYGGTVTRDVDLITFTAGNSIMDGWVRVNARQFDIYVGPPRPAMPSILFPVAEQAADVDSSLTMIGSAFIPGIAGDTQLMSEWVLASDEATLNVVKTQYVNTGDLTQADITGLLPRSAYFARVRYYGANGSISRWSNVLALTTKDAFIPSVFVEELTLPAGNTDANLGYSVDLSTDGGVLVAGAVNYGDSGKLVVYHEENDRNYVKEAEIEASLTSGENVVLNIAVPSGGYVTISADAPGWNSVVYTTDGNGTITTPISMLKMVGRGSNGVPVRVFVNGAEHVLPSAIEETTKVLYVAKELSIGISSAVSGDGLVIAGGSISTMKRSRTMEFEVPEGGSVQLTTNSSLLPSATYVEDAAVNIPLDATTVTLHGKGREGDVGLVVPGTSNAFYGVGNFPYNKYITALRITAKGGTLGTVHFDQVGLPQYPEGLPAYVAPVAGVYKWVPVGVSAVQTGGLYGAPSAEGTPDYKLTSSDQKEQTGSFSTIDQYINYLKTKAPTFTRKRLDLHIPQPIVCSYAGMTKAPDNKSGTLAYGATGAYSANSGDGDSWEVSWSCAITIGFSLVQVTAPVTQVGLPEYPNGLPPYIPAHDDTAVAGSTNIHHDQVGLPAYPSGLPAYVAPVAEVSRWAQAANDPGYSKVTYPTLSSLKSYLDTYYSNSYSKTVHGTISGSTLIYNFGYSEEVWIPPYENGDSTGGGYYETHYYTYYAVYQSYVTTAAVAQQGLPQYPQGLPAYVAAYDETFSSVDTVVRIQGKTLTFSGEGGTTVHYDQVGLPEYPQGLLPYVAPVAEVWRWEPVIEHVSADGSPVFLENMKPIVTGAIDTDAEYLNYLKTQEFEFILQVGDHYGEVITMSYLSQLSNAVFTAFSGTTADGQGSNFMYISGNKVKVTDAVAQQGLPEYPAGLPVYIAAYDTYTPGEGGTTVHHDQIGYPEYPSGLPPYVAPQSDEFTWTPAGGVGKVNGVIGSYGSTYTSTLTPGDSIIQAGSYLTASQYAAYLSTKRPSCRYQSSQSQIGGGLYAYQYTTTDLTYASTTLTGNSGVVTYTGTGTFTPEAGEGYSNPVTLNITYTITFSLIQTQGAVAQQGLPQYPQGLPAYVAAYDEFIPANEAQLTTVDLELTSGLNHDLFYVVAGTGSCSVLSFETSVPSETIKTTNTSLSGFGEIILPYGLSQVNLYGRGSSLQENIATMALLGTGYHFYEPGADTLSETVQLDPLKRYTCEYSVANTGMLLLGWGNESPVMKDIPAISHTFIKDGIFFANKNVNTLTLTGKGSNGAYIDFSWIAFSAYTLGAGVAYAALDSEGWLVQSKDQGITWEDTTKGSLETFTALNSADAGTLGLLALTSGGVVKKYNPDTKAWVNHAVQPTAGHAWVKFAATDDYFLVMSEDGTVFSSTLGLLVYPHAQHTWVDIAALNADGTKFAIVAEDGHVGVYDASWQADGSYTALSAGNTYVSATYVKDYDACDVIASNGKIFRIKLGQPAPVAAIDVPVSGNAIGLSTCAISGRNFVATMDTDGTISLRHTASAKWIEMTYLENREPVRIDGNASTVWINGQAYLFPGSQGEMLAEEKTYSVNLDMHRLTRCDVESNGGYVTISHALTKVNADAGEPSLVKSSGQTYLFPGALNGDIAYTDYTVSMSDEFMHHNTVTTSVKSNGAWTTPRTILANPEETSMFGTSIDMDQSGQRMIVGAQLSNNAQGMAYIYTRNGEEWLLEATLTDSEGYPDARFGSSVAISDDGLVAAVVSMGASQQHWPIAIYERTGGAWSLAKKIVQPSVDAWAGITFDDANYFDEYGRTIDINRDGSYIAFGRPGHTVNGVLKAGSVGVIRRIAGQYVLVEELTAPEANQENRQLGFSVSINGDGDIITAGAPCMTSSGDSNAGCVFTWSRYLNSWTRKNTITRNASLVNPDDLFGFSSALSGDGTVLAVGAANSDHASTSDDGSISIYHTL